MESNKSSHQTQTDGRDIYKPTDLSTLVVCNPFNPNPIARISGLTFLFIDARDPCVNTYIQKIASGYATVYIEESLQKILSLNNVNIIRSLSKLSKGNEARVLFLASNDTHAHFFNTIAEKLDNPLFAVPDPNNKAEDADLVLKQFGWEFCYLNYEKPINKTIENFSPEIIVCASDWSPEYRAIKMIADTMSVPVIAIQEGPQDWGQKINGKDPRKYRNADVFFSQGYRIWQEITPQFSAITGNPKMDTFTPHPLPTTPCVLINCNFTYAQYEDHRNTWVSQVLRCCDELKIQYFISQHPRDYSDWGEFNVVKSSTLTIAEQLRQASIVITRFSNIPYEALSRGRPVIYFNPHQEPMNTFRDRSSQVVIYTENYEELRSALASHSKSMSIDCPKFANYLTEHCTSIKGDAASTIHTYINAIAANAFSIQNFENAFQIHYEILFSVIIRANDQATSLRNTIESVLSNRQDKITYEVIIIDGDRTGNNSKVVEPYKSEGVKYISERKSGSTEPKNSSDGDILGKYVVFLDQGATVDKNWLQSFYTVFSKNPYAAACSGQIKPVFIPYNPRWMTEDSSGFYGGYRVGNEITKCDWVPDTNTVWRTDIVWEASKACFYSKKIGMNPTGNSQGQACQQKGGSENLGHFRSKSIPLDTLKKIKQKGLMRIAAGIKADLYYSPDAIMHHIIGKEKLTISWLITRYYTRGLNTFRHQFNSGKTAFNRRQALRLLAAHSILWLRYLEKMFSSCIFGRKKPFYQNFFRVVENFGAIHETLKYLLRFRH